MAQSSLLAPSASPDSTDMPVSGAAAVTRESLGAFIVSEIARCSGPQLPCYREQKILDGFWERFGPDAMVICQQVFGPAHEGMWRGAPVTLLRFQPQHDEYFAVPLLNEARAN